MFEDVSDKQLAEKIQNLWSQINENTLAQNKAQNTGDYVNFVELERQATHLYMRAADLGLELAKRINPD